MEYISSDTNVWLDFVTIERLELPFKLPYIYLMNEDAVHNELLSPPELSEDLLALGLVEAAQEEEVPVIGTIGILDQLYDGDYIAREEYLQCLKKLQQYNGGRVRLPGKELEKRIGER